MKNNVVTTANATLLLEAGGPTALVRLGTFAIAMGFSSRVSGRQLLAERHCIGQHHTIATK
jgi:hypothetical protein